MHEFKRYLSYTHRNQLKHNCNYIYHTQIPLALKLRRLHFVQTMYLSFLRLFAQTALMSLNGIDQFSSVWRTSVFSVRYELKL
jgi:hypothetical protein